MPRTNRLLFFALALTLLGSASPLSPAAGRPGQPSRGSGSRTAAHVQNGRIAFKRYLDSSPPDFANSCKESVCSIESVAIALSGENDLTKAIHKTVRAGFVPAAIGEAIIKVYAFRGNEPGVGHGKVSPPAVTREDAELLFNLAGSIGKYLSEKLRK